MSVATKAITSAAIVGSGDVACQTLFENRSLRRVKNANSGNQEGEIAIAEPAVGRAAAESAVGRAAGSCHPFDYARLGNMTLLGAVLVAPVLHLWYGFLGRKMPGTAIGPVMGRVVLDQALFAPTFIAVFFSSLAVLRCSSCRTSCTPLPLFCTLCDGQTETWLVTKWHLCLCMQALEGKSLQQLEQQLRDSWVESVITNWKLWVPCQIINLGFVPGHLQVLVSNVVALVWNSYMSYITHRPAATPSRTV